VQTASHDRQRRVLVIDDDPLNRKLAVLHLRQAGYETATADSGAAGMEIAHARPPDAILADVLMPAIDGFALCATLRADPLLSQVPVVLMSAAYVEEADRRLARELGAHALVCQAPGYAAALAALDDAMSWPVRRAVEAPGRLATLHRQRVQTQLDQHLTRHGEELARLTAQSHALSVLAATANPALAPGATVEAAGRAIIQCLDAAGLAAGLVYLYDLDGRLVLHEQCGLASWRRGAAEACFGQPALLSTVASGPAPVGLHTRAAEGPGAALLAGLGHGSALLLPLACADRGLGVVVLAAAGGDLSTAEWVQFGEQVMAHLRHTLVLSQAFERLQQTAEGVPDVIWAARPGMTEMLHVSPAFARLFGHDRTSLCRSPDLWFAAVHPDDRARVQAEALTSTPLDQTYRIVRRDGEVRWLRTRSFALANADGSCRVGMSEDITERRRTEAHLAELSQRLVDVQEEERRRVSRELHDEAGQLLTGLKLTLEAGARTGCTDLALVGDLVDQLAARLRNLALDLRPPMLDDLGLIPTLLWHHQRYQEQTRVRVDFRHQGLSARLPAAVEAAAFRVVQEALTNVARHAQAETAAVRVRLVGEVLSLQVSDRGRGFDPGALAETGTGLLGMRERVSRLGGRLTVESAPRCGTRVWGEIPCTSAPGTGPGSAHV
jgi:PAS domain S-box-containing protein